MTKKPIVVALGGNAIKQSDEQGTTEEQFRNVDIAAREIAGLIRDGHQVVVTHGNGPQAGSLLIQQECGEQQEVPSQTLAVCGAMTQGQIGWMLQNRLSFRLREMGIETPVCTVVTQVEVSKDDPDFQNPSKPVGPFYTPEEAKGLHETKGYIVKEVKPGSEKSWRRVVPSPEPIDIIEKEGINALIESGAVVIASGGGGIPVAKNGDGSLEGIDAVIDKDRAGVVLAKTVGAEKFVILTDVEKVCLRYNTPEQTELDGFTVEEGEKLMEEGHFLKGSMGPKVEAALEFAKWSGRAAIITSLRSAGEALKGKTGTFIGSAGREAVTA